MEINTNMLLAIIGELEVIKRRQAEEIENLRHQLSQVIGAVEEPITQASMNDEVGIPKGTVATHD